MASPISPPVVDRAHTEGLPAYIDSEIQIVMPRVIVLLGSTAMEALLGKGHTIRDLRGPVTPGEPDHKIYVTVHPSSILRAQDKQSRQEQMAEFVSDLREAAGLVSAT